VEKSNLTNSVNHYCKAENAFVEEIVRDYYSRDLGNRVIAKYYLSDYNVK